MPAYRTRDAHSRSTLEVTTDAPLTPEVTIVSPTPRAFTFPITHDVPYASPSSSPFEPELKSCATPPPPRALSPTSSIGSETSSLLSTPSATTSSQVSHRRRRSTVSDNERRPKKGDEDYIKRPENAFILFRRKCCEDRQQALDEGDDAPAAPVKKQRQADLSKMISQQWKGLPAEERQYWEDLAKEKKKEHEQMYPNYVYRPQRVKKSKKGKGRRGDDEQDTEDSISFMMPVPSPPRSLSRDHSYAHGHSRRALSAPTPPPMYQAIQLPTVYMPSCPPSPTGVPRISRRVSYIPPPNDAGPATHFEYLPQGTILPPSLDAHSTYDSNFSYDTSYHPIQFDNPHPFSGRPSNPLPSLSIPPEQASYSMLSPAESIASSLFSSGDGVPSSMSSSASSSGPFTPADSLSISALNISQPHRPEAKGVPEDVEDDISGAELGFGGYSTWSPEPLWPEHGELIITDDFNLASIPPVELGMTLPEPSGSEAEAPYGAISDEPFGDAGQDPFASLFSYDGMNW